MHREALFELDQIDATLAGRPEVIEMRLLILMHAKRWKEALSASRKLCVIAPETAAGYIHAAFCLHELGRTRDARDILLQGPPALQREATFHYNLACYECALGEIEEAYTHLQASFAIDRKFRDFAKNDSDLEPLRERL